MQLPTDSVSMPGMILFYVPCPSAGDADALADALLQDGLIACANRLSPVQSRFIWEGEIQVEEEHPLLLKTSEDRADEVAVRVNLLHPYEVPAIIRLSAESNLEFNRWVCSVTSGDGA